jgi:hypothetical protein
LATARQRANVTQQKLVQLRNPQSRWYQAFEAGKRRGNPIKFLLIARTLGADTLDILSEIVG